MSSSSATEQSLTKTQRWEAGWGEGESSWKTFPSMEQKMCPSLLRQMPLFFGFRLGNVLSLVFVLQKCHFVIYQFFLDSFYPWFSFAGASATLRKTFQSADCLRQLCPNYNPRVREKTSFNTISLFHSGIYPTQGSPGKYLWHEWRWNEMLGKIIIATKSGAFKIILVSAQKKLHHGKDISRNGISFGGQVLPNIAGAQKYLFFLSRRSLPTLLICSSCCQNHLFFTSFSPSLAKRKTENYLICIFYDQLLLQRKHRYNI